MKTSHLIIASALAAVVAVAGIVALYDAMQEDPKEVTIEYTITNVREGVAWSATYSFDMTDVPVGTKYFNSIDSYARTVSEYSREVLVTSEETDTLAGLLSLEWTFEHEGYVFTTKLVDRL